jgi:NurA domain
MPYQGETASKASHFDIVKNPQVGGFLAECTYLKEPSEAEAAAMTAVFREPPRTDAPLPRHVMAIDGSYHESSLDDRLPSTKVGYVKIGCVLIEMAQYQDLRVMDGRFVDPFRVARLEENNAPLTFPLPSANIRWKNKDSVRDSFRPVVDAHLDGDATRFNPADRATSLRATLFELASRRAGAMGTGDPRTLRIHKCPSCGADGPFTLADVPTPQACPRCGEELYPTDCLRLWEEVSDHQSNVQAMTRFMLQIEHMLGVHYVRYLARHALSSLAGLAVFIDGPLAVFGNGAWLHAAIMDFLAEVNARLAAAGLPGLLVIGLQKTGQVVDHARSIDRFLARDRLLPIGDDYRYTYVLGGRDAAGNGFGAETYYGQDFIYKTPTGRTFVFGLPYPFRTKSQPGLDFVREKIDAGRYATLPRALRLIDEFESDLYENAVVPIALAHHYTAISLVPGGRVLDLLTRNAITQ